MARPEEAGSDKALLIFISYRRDDAAGYAGRLYDLLAARFHPQHVFMDVDTIEPGADFVQVIQDAVGRCDALLAIIGPGWLDAVDHTGRRRLDDPNDFVRLEIEAALHREVRVVPILVQGAEMPGPGDLPEPLVALSRRNALEMSHGRWHADAARLVAVLDKMEEAKAKGSERSIAPQSAPTPSMPDAGSADVVPPVEGTGAESERKGPVSRRLMALAGIGAAFMVGGGLVAAAVFGWIPASSPSPTPQASASAIGRTACPPLPGTSDAAPGRMAFSSTRGGGGPELYSLDLASGRIDLLMPNALGDSYRDGDPVWSPDGSKIAFVRKSGAGEDDIWILAVEEGRQTQVTRDPAADSQPAWSPDGQWLAFTSLRQADDDQIYVARADGSDAQAVTHVDGRVRAPSWSPDGSAIAISVGPSDAGEIMTFAIDVDVAPGSPVIAGEARPTHVDPLADDSSPTWSPDGSLILFTRREPDAAPDLYLLDVNEDRATALTTTAEGEGKPAWSPDGSRVAYERGSDVWATNVDGGCQQPLTSDEGADTHPSWH
jgi:hypothetical protein